MPIGRFLGDGTDGAACKLKSVTITDFCNKISFFPKCILFLFSKFKSNNWFQNLLRHVNTRSKHTAMFYLMQHPVFPVKHK